MRVAGDPHHTTDVPGSGGRIARWAVRTAPPEVVMSRSRSSSRHDPVVATDRPDGGQTTVLVAAGLVLAAVVLLAVVAAGSLVVDGARARTAADAAALAGAAEGREAAGALARANDGRLVAYRSDGPEVTVTVVVGRARATARARQDGTWCHTEGSSGRRISYTEPPCPSTPG